MSENEFPITVANSFQAVSAIMQIKSPAKTNTTLDRLFFVYPTTASIGKKAPTVVKDKELMYKYFIEN
jgi:hypothetical protein